METESNQTILEQILTTPTELSREQKVAVTAHEKQVKIIAGAGAGKTETLTRRIVYLLLLENAQPSEIVAFTFTEKAAQSLKSRIYQRVQQLAGESVSSKLGEMFIGTIHGYAKRLLDDHFGAGKYDVLDQNQEIAFLMRHGWNLDLGGYGRNYAEGCTNFLRTITMVWDEMLDVTELERRAKTFCRHMRAYEHILDDNCQLTFGRMMYLAATKVRERPEVVSGIKHLIVDEYQDINKAQMSLIETIGQRASLFIVGDPRQSIYQWRGSNEQFFSKFSEGHPGLREISITDNRRSGSSIVQVANKFAESFQAARYDPMQPARGSKGFVGLSANETPTDEASWVVDQIENLVDKNGLAYSDIGIMMRSINTSAGPLLDELRRRRIPFIVGGKAGLFRKDEAQAVGRIFAWLSDDGFWIDDAWSWANRTQGDALLNTGLTFWANVMGTRVPTDVRERLIEIKAEVLEPRSKYHNLSKIYQQVIIALGFHSFDHKDRNDAAIMANLGRFSNLLTDYETANRLGGRQPQWGRDLKGLCWFINSYGNQAYEEGMPEDIRGVNAVQVLTVHQAKGLEWPVAFVISMTDRRFPSKNVGKAQQWCGVPRSMFDAARYEGSIEDERRLFYVAITRARDALIVSYFKRKTNRVQRSIFIGDLGHDDLAKLGGEKCISKVDAMSQASPDQEILTFSAGEIIDYDRCPYSYLLGNVWNFQPGLDQGLGFGKSLHHCLRSASDLVRHEGINPASAVATAIEDDFHMPFASGKVLDDFHDKALETLVNFAEKYSEDFGRIEEVEYRLEFPVHGASITGRVDVLLRDGQGLEVRDYKTSEDARSYEETSVQVQLYALGLNGLGRRIEKGSVAYLEEVDVQDIPINEDNLASRLAQAEESIESIKGCKFEPRVGDGCKACDRKVICRWS